MENAIAEKINKISDKLIIKDVFSDVNKYNPVRHMATATHIDQCIDFLRNIFSMIGTIGTYKAVIKAALETSVKRRAYC